MSTGTQYPLTSILDVMLLYGKLPPDRAEVMLSELMQGVRLSAPALKMMALFDGIEVDPQPFIWIDDDEGRGEVRFTNGETGENVVSFVYENGELVG